MKRLFLVLVAASLLVGSCAIAYAADGSADISMGGEIFSIVLDSIDIVDGELTVEMEGFGDTLKMDSNGPIYPAWPIARFGETEMSPVRVHMVVGGIFTFTFESAELPDELWMDPRDDDKENVLIWEASDGAIKSSDQNISDENPDVTEDPTASPTAEPITEPTAETDISMIILDTLNNEVYVNTYEALCAGESVEKGTKSETAKGLQLTLIALGQDISADGNAGKKTLAALNNVQSALELDITDSVDAEGYAALFPALLCITDEENAKNLHEEYGIFENSDDFAYKMGLAMELNGRFATARKYFTECTYPEAAEHAKACEKPWPKTGQLYKNSAVKGSATELTVKFNSTEDRAMMVKIYTLDDVLARTLFIGGTGKATTKLPAGTYIIKDGTGSIWYGEKEAFGDEGSYEIMTFNDGIQEITLKSGYSTTITVNVSQLDESASTLR